MPVLYEKRNHIGWLTLSRPQARNCWGEDFNEEIAQRCDEMAADDEVRVAVLTGARRATRFRPAPTSRTRAPTPKHRWRISSPACRSGVAPPAKC
jgi:hypothetical protein